MARRQAFTSGQETDMADGRHNIVQETSQTVRRPPALEYSIRTV